MAERLLKYYDIVEKEGGVVGKTRLAMKTGLSSAKAEAADDSAELLEKFHKVTCEILGKTVPKQ